MRVTPAKPAGMPAGPSSGTSSGSDPLAELARLIGQNDPFAEYGRTSAAPQAAPAANPNPPNFYDAPVALQPPSTPKMPEVQPFSPPNFARQSFGGPPIDSPHDHFPIEGEEQRYAEPHAGAHDDDLFHQNNAQHASEEGDFYEDAPPSGRRKVVMVIAGIFALAVIGSAGAFGYRALFHSTGPSAEPPVIKAESAPSKIVPASNKDAPSKLITDRVDIPGQNEKLVSREEKPVDIKDKPAGALFPPAQSQSGNSTPAPGSGVVSPDAKRVRTIAIRPDQATIADSIPTVTQPATPVPPPRVTPNTPPRQAAAPEVQQQQSPPAPVANAPQAVVPETAATPAGRQPAPRVPPAVSQQQAAASSNAPLSLSPDAPAPARVAPARTATPPVRTTTAAVPTQLAPAATSATAATGSAAGGGYAVQVSSQRSEADAQAAFRSQQSKYPDLLGSKQPMIHKVDLGAKGIYYRVMIGPFANGSEASQLCSSLKAAGGQCIIQRN